MIDLIKQKGINPQTKQEIFFPRWTRVATTDNMSLAGRVARGETFSKGDVAGVTAALPEYIIDELLNGNAVQLDGMGTFKLRVSGKSDADKEKVTSAGIKIEVVFTPAANLQSRIQNEAKFRFVTKPSKDGEQDAEDSGNGQSTDNGGNGQSSNGGNTDNGGNGQGNTGDGEDLNG
jgi:predicted histone-like DNA-binding protein